MTAESTGARQRARKKRKLRLKWVLLLIAALLFAMVVALAIFMGVVLATNHQIDESQLIMSQTSTLYDQNGEEITRLFAVENRDYLSIDEIPDLVKDTFVAVEDRRFYEHQGIDPRGIARALYRDVIARSAAEGGSTITQQLARNVFLTHEKSLMRKTQEALIALNLERRYTKDDILEMYLNYIYFGHQAYGIQAAAEVYFDKDDLDELTHEEVAMLASLPRGPNLYSPLREGNEERSENRRRTVLMVMEELDIITPEEREIAAEKELVLNEEPGYATDPAYFTFIDMVADEAEERYGIDGEDLLTGGYHIYTTLHSNAQQTMYEAMHVDGSESEALFPESGPEQIVQGSMVIYDHHTGAVHAVMGGRDYTRKGFNRAVNNGRDTGSSFKPLAVYAPALEEGWSPTDTVRDELLTYPGDYTPRNVGGVYRGYIPMSKAVEVSSNAAAVWLLNEIGIDRGLASLEHFGFDVKPEDRELRIALGSYGASTMSMARSFGAFANDGIMIEPHFIERIEDRNGSTVAEHDVQFDTVISEQSAWYMTRMLQQVVESGTGTNARLNHPVAGKTGTVQYDDVDGNRDAWFVGYTPHLTAAVWMGFDQPNPSHGLQTSGGQHPARLFQHVMGEVLADYPVEPFSRPGGVEEPVQPVQMQQITDLRGFVTLHGDEQLSVDLEFTPNDDERVHYRIVRIGEGDQRQVIADVSKGELVNGRGWTDRNVHLFDVYAYEVVPYNSETGEEGPTSNQVQMVIDPSSPLFRRADDVDEEQFMDWINEELGEEDEEEVEEGNENNSIANDGNENDDGNNGEEREEGPPGHQDGHPGQGQGPGNREDNNDNDGNENESNENEGGSDNEESSGSDNDLNEDPPENNDNDEGTENETNEQAWLPLLQ